jgi:hypothetical protein
MGTTFTNVSFHRAESRKIAEALRKERVRKSFVSPALAGWVTVYDENASFHTAACSLARAICRACRVAAIVISVEDSDYLKYSAVDSSGSVVDESIPRQEPGTREDRHGLVGDLDKMLSTFGLKDKTATLQEALERETVYADHCAQELAGVLGIQNVLLGYRYILEDWHELAGDLVGRDGFVYLNSRGEIEPAVACAELQS